MGTLPYTGALTTLYSTGRFDNPEKSSHISSFGEKREPVRRLCVHRKVKIYFHSGEHGEGITRYEETEWVQWVSARARKSPASDSDRT